MADIELKVGDKQEIPFYLTDASGAALDVSSAQLTMKFKRHKSETDAVISKEDSDFDKTDAGDGLVSVWINEQDCDNGPCRLIGDIRIVYAGGPKLHTGDFTMTIEESVT